MISLLAGIVGIALGAAFFTEPAPEPKPVPIMQCSMACGSERMVEYQTVHGVCKCK